MTDAEHRDAAVVHLKKTTVGYVNKRWTTPPAGSEWKQALDELALIGAVAPPPPPPPSWAPPALSNPVPWAMTNANRMSSSLLSGAGRDMKISSSETLGAIQQLNAWRHIVWSNFRLDVRGSGDNYALPISATGIVHLEDFDIYCDGDGLMSRGGSSECIWQLQNGRIEVHFLGEPREHSDCLQLQGGAKIKELRVADFELVTDYQGFFLRPPTPDSYLRGGILRRVQFRQRVPGQDPAQAYLFIADEDPATGHATSGVGPIVCEDVWMEVADPQNHNWVLYPDIFFSDFKVGGRYTNRQGAYLEQDALGWYYRPSTSSDVVPGNGPASGQQCLPAGWLGIIRIGVRP